jgi:hypothetical protein
MYQISLYIPNKNNDYIKTYDYLCSEVQQMSNTTQLQIAQEATETKLDTALIELNKLSCSTGTVFERLLLDAVDAVFSKIGGSNYQTLYLHLKSNFGVERAEMAYNLGSFVNALELLFGQGALLVEAQIMAVIHSKVPDFKFTRKQGDLSFLNYLESLRCFANSD